MPPWRQLPSQQPASVYTDCCVSSSWSGQERIAAIDTSSEEALADSLREVREVVKFLELPEALQTELSAAMKASGMYVPEDAEEWFRAYNALRGVWASKVSVKPQASPTRSPTHLPPRAPPRVYQYVSVRLWPSNIHAALYPYPQGTLLDARLSIHLSPHTPQHPSPPVLVAFMIRLAVVEDQTAWAFAGPGRVDTGGTGAASSPHSGRSVRTSACATWASTMQTCA